MASKQNSYKCEECGASYPKWVGRCIKCREFGTVVESVPVAGNSKAGVKGTTGHMVNVTPARKVRDITKTSYERYTTGVGEFDRVLGGGVVPGQVILIAGEPGVGKSTLLLSAAHSFAETGETVLYVTGEESAEQIGLRAERIGVDSANLYVADETDLEAVLTHISSENPGFIIVDSVQTIASPNLDGRAGGMAQVHEVATMITRIAKQTQTPTIIVGQINKSNDLAGPKTLEHLVDTVLMFEGDANSGLRLLRTTKNRFGPADEIACFEQTETGVKEVVDPSGLFLTDREDAIAGVATTVMMEGRRPLVAEIQALSTFTNSPNPRRGVSGLDYNRAAMLSAVTEKYGRVKLYDKDTFLATVGGMRITEPAADLAICLSLLSTVKDSAFPSDAVAIGEVTLSGDIRRVRNAKQRLSEAARLGYRKAFVPVGTEHLENIVSIPVGHLTDMLKLFVSSEPSKI